jgi:hypothetical protein
MSLDVAKRFVLHAPTAVWVLVVETSLLVAATFALPTTSRSDGFHRLILLAVAIGIATTGWLVAPSSNRELNWVRVRAAAGGCAGAAWFVAVTPRWYVPLAVSATLSVVFRRATRLIRLQHLSLAVASVAVVALLDEERVQRTVDALVRVGLPATVVLFVLGLTSTLSTLLESTTVVRFHRHGNAVLLVVVVVKYSWFTAAFFEILPATFANGLPTFQLTPPPVDYYALLGLFLVLIVAGPFQGDSLLGQRLGLIFVGVTVVLVSWWSIDQHNGNFLPAPSWLYARLGGLAALSGMFSVFAFIRRRPADAMLLAGFAGWCLVLRITRERTSLPFLDWFVSAALVRFAIDGWRGKGWFLSPIRIAALLVGATLAARFATWVPQTATSTSVFLVVTGGFIVLRVLLWAVVSHPSDPISLAPDVFVLSFASAGFLADRESLVVSTAAATSTTLHYLFAPVFVIWFVSAQVLLQHRVTGTPTDDRLPGTLERLLARVHPRNQPRIALSSSGVEVCEKAYKHVEDQYAVVGTAIDYVVNHEHGNVVVRCVEDLLPHTVVVAVISPVVNDLMLEGPVLPIGRLERLDLSFVYVHAMVDPGCEAEIHLAVEVAVRLQAQPGDTYYDTVELFA